MKQSNVDSIEIYALEERQNIHAPKPPCLQIYFREAAKMTFHFHITYEAQTWRRIGNEKFVKCRIQIWLYKCRRKKMIFNTIILKYISR